MNITFSDRAKIGDIRYTIDGYLVTTARVARTGIQQYHSSELGIQGDKTFNIYRPEEEVFNKDSMASYAHRPVTASDGMHPPQPVTAKTWRDSSPAGSIGGEVARDGEYVAVPLVIMDGEAIESLKDTRELSMGYTAALDMTPGETPSGEKYDGVQRNLRMNHLAIVDRARGGSQLKIGDQHRGVKVNDKLRTVIVDGLSVETTDQGAQAIEKLTKQVANLQDDINSSAQKMQDAKAEHDKAMGAKDAEIADLKKAQLTDAQIDEKIAQRMSLIDSARLLKPDLDPSSKSDLDVIKVALSAYDSTINLDQSVDYLRGMFDHAVSKVKVQTPLTRQYKQDNHQQNNFVDANVARQEYDTYLSNAWRGNQQGSAH